ncbi:MAG: 2-hydroxychromene-2-carboxylate isomerase [Deltaproteobacteria bacterium]
MAATLEFFFDYGSPTTYLADTQIEALAERSGAKLVYRPMLLGGVFKATGNRSPVEVPAKGVYMGADMARFAKRYGVPMNMNPFFPVNTLPLMRGAVVAQHDGFFAAYQKAMFRAMWVDEKDMNDPAVIGEVVSAAGIDVTSLLKRTGEQDIKDELKATTEEAVNRGAFGAPTFFVGDEMFFGQDRLEFVEAVLSG